MSSFGQILECEKMMIKYHFYTGFPNYAALKISYDYLGPAIDNLIYWGSDDSSSK